jgi:hypothetical protein
LGLGRELPRGVLARLCLTDNFWVSLFVRNFAPFPAFPTMPLYFFDVQFADDRELTDEAMWFPNLEQAELEAQGTAEEILRKLGKERVTVRIRDHCRRIQSEIDVSI